MENSTLLLTLLSTLFAKTMSAENIEISSSSPISSSTFNPLVEKSTAREEKSSNFLNTVENYLPDGLSSQNINSQKQLQGYISHPMVPVYSNYNGAGSFYPGVNPNAVSQSSNEVQSSNYFSSVLPIAQAALQAGLKLFAKVGLSIIGGAALLLIGGFFTTLVCYVTPLCTMIFNGYDFKALNKGTAQLLSNVETVRSLMAPEKFAMVQDAIGNYEGLQRAVAESKKILLSKEKKN